MRYDSYDYTISTGKVVAGSPSSSKLYTTTNSGSMPPGGKLSTSDINAIRDWIAAGALNN